jgi:hypothetical protein
MCWRCTWTTTSFYDIVGPAGSFIMGFKSAFGERFNVQDLGPVSWLLA